MGLFVKKTNPITTPLYTVGAQNTLLIVGLGNPEKKYDVTRHNLGFTAIDYFVSSHEEFGKWIEKKDFKALVTSGTLGDTRVIVMKPHTYMNLSGEAVRAVEMYYKVPVEQIVVVYDELDLPWGTIRTQMGGSSAGHNGIKSLIEHVEAGFGRVRIGIKNELTEIKDSADFVLGKLNKEEQAHLKPLLKEVDSILVERIYRGDLLPETRTFLT